MLSELCSPRAAPSLSLPSEQRWTMRQCDLAHAVTPHSKGHLWGKTATFACSHSRFFSHTCPCCSHQDFPVPLQHIPPPRGHTHTPPSPKSITPLQPAPSSWELTGDETCRIHGHHDVSLEQEVRQGLQQSLQQPQHTNIPELSQHLPGTAARLRPQNIPVPAGVTATGCPPLL